MLGESHIRTGTIIVLISLALFGCSVPVPFIHTEPQVAPQIPSPAPVAAAKNTPQAQHSKVAPQARIEGPDLWRKIGAGLTLHTSRHHRPSAPLAHLPYGKRVIESASAQSAPYLYFIVSELEQRKLPYEIALIPLLESGFNPAAGTRGGPGGLWQMIPATGQRFGLQQTAWYDGRRDVVDSTRAALHYLENLKGEFNGDWLLAIAAYNCGERTVAQAVERNRNRGRPTDFWSLGLPSGTRHYVERLLNVAAMVADPAAFGVRPALVRDRPFFDIVDVGADLPLSHITVASGLSADEFRTLNAGLLKHTTVTGATRILVAAGQGDAMTLALSSVSDQVRRLPVSASVADAPSPQAAPRGRYTVRSGDSLSVVAARTKVSMRELRELNHLSSTHLRLGQVLRLPAPIKPVATATGKPAALNTAATETRTTTPGTHVVTRGDNLWDVARHYQITAEALAKANSVTSHTVLKLGQKLRLPAGAPAQRARRSMLLASADNAQNIGYRVRQGDSLWTISRRFNVSVDALKKWNRLSTGSASLRPGQRLVVNGET